MRMLRCASNLLPRLASKMPAVGGKTNPIPLREGKEKARLYFFIYFYYEKLEAYTRVECMVQGIPATHHPASTLTNSRPILFHLNAFHSSLTSDIEKQNPDSNHVFHTYFSI